MAENFADRLCTTIVEENTRAVVGIDPRADLLPSDMKRADDSPEAVGKAFVSFAREVIDAVEPYVCAVKVQIAFYEALGVEGLKAYAETLRCAREKGLITIGDIKRGDIGSTAAAYAAGHLTPGSEFEADAVTVNPYFGHDGLEPFIEKCFEHGKGIFVLLRTSNPTAGQIQDAGGEPPVWEKLAVLISEWGQGLTGTHGYSSVGAVMGATYPRDALRARELAPSTILLMPGYGTQGGSAGDIAECMDENGLGAVVPSSRSIIYAFRDSNGGEADEWQDSVANAARATRDEINQRRK